MVVNESEQCTGDAGFLYNGTLDHASLGPDAEIDSTISPVFLLYGGGASSQTLMVRQTESAASSINLSGLFSEFNVTSAGGNGIQNSKLSGVTSRAILTGTTSSTNGIDTSTIIPFNAETQISLTSNSADITGNSLNPIVGYNYQAYPKLT